MADYSVVAEDLEWLKQDWWTNQGADLSPADVRRGSASVALLLSQGLMGRAWRAHGFDREPSVIAPDLEALAEQKGLQLEMSPALVAGGGRVANVEMIMVGAFRVDNPTTGVPADADEGFAVKVGAIARDTSTGAEPRDALIHKEWRVSQYLKAVGAVRKGQRISRQQIIAYFRNYAGGAHLDAVLLHAQRKTPQQELVHDLRRHVIADTWDGLFFEMLSIGQCVGRASDSDRLVRAIRERL